MVIITDTSFLFSFYGRDTNTNRARKILQGLRTPLTASPFNDFEFANAVRLSAFQHILTEEIARAMLADFEADKAAGRIISGIHNLSDVLIEASRISAIHTPSGGFRAFDILHVAVANIAKADVFLTFDKDQTILAQKLGLNTSP